jgi:hypothetical protein
MYIQFVQKDRADLERCRELLMCIGVSSGKIHNPSVRVDPDYWRFYIPVRSHAAFMAEVGSWHPRKRRILSSRRRELAQGASSEVAKSPTTT